MNSQANLERARSEMLRSQLQARGIRSRRVLQAMAKVPRECFVSIDPPLQAYSDQALAIGCGQTISQPYMVALMTEALELSGHERVLEIGTGSGYQAAVLAELAEEVITIERHAELSRQAGRLLADLGYRNITLVIGDGTAGWPARAPYDRIIVTAAASRCPAALFSQLSEGGLLVIPLGDSSGQMLKRIYKENGMPVVSDLTGCRFVPLVGAQGEPPGAA